MFALTKVGFHKQQSQIQSCKSTYDLVKITSRSHKQSQVQQNWSQKKNRNFKQLLDEVFVISGIIKVEVSVISLSRRLRLITLTETLIIPDITKTESNNCFIILYLQVISQFLAGLMKGIEKPFLLRCPRT